MSNHESARGDYVSVIEQAADIYREELNHAIREELQRVIREEVKCELEHISELREPATMYKDGGGEEWERALIRRYWNAAAELSYAVDAGQTQIDINEFVHALHYLEKGGYITIT